MWCHSAKHLVPLGVLLAAAGAQATATPCLSIPGDPTWPANPLWSQLNQTLSGRLIATVPLASICHISPYQVFDETACANLRADWDLAQTHVSDPTSVMNAAFQNESCDPFRPASMPCELGNYASYSINVTNVNDIVAGIEFARKHNIRLVIKNTGHDFMGKSTGKGSLSLWTHHLNDSQIIPEYVSSFYTGPAVKVGAGVIAGFLYKTVADAGYRVVGGTCASTGIAGGYTAGGGHSIINGLYGMAADNVLEWDIVTADGSLVTATPDNQYSDLYWAASGGGGGTWGVVVSMTTRVFPDGPVGGASLTYNASNIDADTFWEAIEAWYAYLPSYTDGLNGGNTVEFEVTATVFAAISFTVPNGSLADIDSLLAPYLARLNDLGIEYSYSSHTSPSYYEHYDRDLGPLPYGPWPGDILFSNRLFPRSISENATTNSALVETIRNMTTFQDGYFWLGCMAVNVNISTGHPENAVLPAFRDVLGICTVIGYWDWTVPISGMWERKAYLVDEIVPAFEAVTPGSGSYLNEVDSWYKGDWKREFYGSNYDQLLQVKNKYDPTHLFYAYTGVGSDYWSTDDSGRLCRT